MVGGATPASSGSEVGAGRRARYVVNKCAICGAETLSRDAFLPGGQYVPMMDRLAHAEAAHGITADDDSEC